MLLMQAVSEVFIEMGGHHVAGGFSVKDEHIFTFGERLVSAMETLSDEATVDSEVLVDAEISLDEVDQFLVRQLDILAPFGTDNHKPIFAFKNVSPQSVELFGKAKEHTKLIFQTEKGKIEAIAFFQTPTEFTKTPEVGALCTPIGHVEESFSWAEDS